MPISQRPEVPRLSSTYLKNLPINDQITYNYDESDIPSCGVDIVPRPKINDNIVSPDDSFKVSVVPSTRERATKLKLTAKTDEEDDSLESIVHKNALEEQEEKVKYDRQLKGREFAKEQRRRWRSEALKIKEDAEQEKRNKAERLAALGKKARKFACEPLPEYPRQQLAKSRSEMKRKNEVYVAPDDDAGTDNDVSVHALQWALGEGGRGDEFNATNVSYSRTILNSIDMPSENVRESEAEYSAESKGGEHSRRSINYSTNDSQVPLHNRTARFDFQNQNSDIPNNDRKKNFRIEEVNRVNQKYNDNQPERKSIFELGLINDMGRIRVYSENNPGNVPPNVPKKSKKPKKASIKMFSPSYKQESVAPTIKPKMSTYNQNQVRTVSDPSSRARDGRGPSPGPVRSPPGTSQGVRVDVRDTKGNIVRQIMRPVVQGYTTGV